MTVADFSDTLQVQINVGFVLEAQLGEVADDLDVHGGVGIAIHGQGQQEIASYAGELRVDDPHFNLGDHHQADLAKKITDNY